MEDILNILLSILASFFPFICCGGFILLILLAVIFISTRKNKTGNQKLTSPEKAPHTPQTYGTPTQEAIYHYQRAKELEIANEGEMDITLKKDILAELAVAIQKANAPFPDAHSMIARYFYKTYDDKNAEHHANIALQQDPNQFYAQLVRIDLARERVVKRGQQAMKSLESNPSLVNTLYQGGVGMSQINSLISDVKNEIIKLVYIFRRNWENGIEANEYLKISRDIIELGDFIQDITFPGGRPNIFAEVVYVPIEKIGNIEGVEQQISEIRSKAEGRALIFNPN